ncbi:MAG TPA: hypothetical protein VIO61_01455 [Anaerolineaceae bacterium]
MSNSLGNGGSETPNFFCNHAENTPFPYHKRKPVAAIQIAILLLFFLTLGCISFSFPAPFRTPVSQGIQAVEVARGRMDEKGGKISSKQGLEIILPAGALDDQYEYAVYQLKGVPEWMPAVGILPAGDGYEITFQGLKKLAAPAEIRMPLSVSSNVDRSLYSIFTSDGEEWSDAGGIVDGRTIRTWTTHFSLFFPGQAPTPHRPVGFNNIGIYNATINVNSYVPDPAFPPAAFPTGSTVSFTPTSPGIPSSRYLLVPVGTFIFCIEWTDGKDENKDNYFDYYHVFSVPFSVFESDPKALEMAKSMQITPGQYAKPLAGICPRATPAPPFFPVRTRTPTRTPLVDQPRSGGKTTWTPTLTQKTDDHAPGIRYTPTFTFTPTRTRTRTLTLPTRGGTLPPSRTRINYLPYYKAWIKRCDDLRYEYQQKNCKPIYSGCFDDILGVPTPLREYLYTDYWVNLHPSYLTFAQSLEDQILAGVKKCYEEFLAKPKTINLDVRKGEQSACIFAEMAKIDKELARIRQTSCSAACGEQGKTGVLEGSPLGCNCK